MPQHNRKNKSSNDNNRPSPIITSPEGVKIQITAGRKLQAIRSFARDPEITDAQFRSIVCIVDRLNEGRGEERLWGSAYPNFETLAADIAKDVRSAKRIVKELETGQRETRSDGVKKLSPGKVVLSVQRSKDQDGKDSVNEYRLKEWGAFVVAEQFEEGAVTAPIQSGEGAVTCKEGCGDLSGRVRSPVGKGAVTAPDSTHLLSSETPPTNSPHMAPACVEREPVASIVDEVRPTQPGNDNDPEWPSADDAVAKFAFHYPKAVDPSKIRNLLEEIRKDGRTKFKDILRGASHYKKETVETKLEFIKWPENFLKGRHWEGYQRDRTKTRFKKVVAI